MTRALVLAGGGAKGAYQASAVSYLERNHGYEWDVVAGVSVGALNGALVAQGRTPELIQLWHELSRSKVFKRGNAFRWLWRALRGRLSIFDSTPLWELVQERVRYEDFFLEDGTSKVEFLAGATILETGEYEAKTPAEVVPGHMVDWIVASAAIPVAFTPIWWPDVEGNEDFHLVDGGVRNNAPLSDVLEFDPDEIVVVLCNNRTVERVHSPRHILDVALRSLSIAMHEVFIQDLDRFLVMNELVKQAGPGVLKRSDGTPYKAYEVLIIEPSGDLGDTLDFSKKTLERRMHLGIHDAAEAVNGPR